MKYILILFLFGCEREIRNYVEEERREDSYIERAREDVRKGTEDFNRQNEYYFRVRNGLIKSGIEDIDDTVVAHSRLQDVPGSYWPRERVNKYILNRKEWREYIKREDNEELPNEKKIGQSSYTPNWVKPMGE